MNSTRSVLNSSGTAVAQPYSYWCYQGVIRMRDFCYANL